MSHLNKQASWSFTCALYQFEGYKGFIQTNLSIQFSSSKVRRLIRLLKYGIRIAGCDEKIIEQFYIWTLQNEKKKKKKLGKNFSKIKFWLQVTPAINCAMKKISYIQFLDTYIKYTVQATDPKLYNSQLTDFVLCVWLEMRNVKILNKKMLNHKIRRRSKR